MKWMALQFDSEALVLLRVSFKAERHGYQLWILNSTVFSLDSVLPSISFSFYLQSSKREVVFCSQIKTMYHRGITLVRGKDIEKWIISIWKILPAVSDIGLREHEGPNLIRHQIGEEMSCDPDPIKTQEEGQSSNVNEHGTSPCSPYPPLAPSRWNGGPWLSKRGPFKIK